MYQIINKKLSYDRLFLKNNNNLETDNFIFDYNNNMNFLTIFTWIFTWTLYSNCIHLLNISKRQELFICLSGLLIIYNISNKFENI